MTYPGISKDKYFYPILHKISERYPRIGQISRDRSHVALSLDIFYQIGICVLIMRSQFNLI